MTMRGQTIDESIENLVKFKKLFSNNAYTDSLKNAIDIMRKYQEIADILVRIPYGGDCTVYRIKEVIERGNEYDK